MTSTIRKVREGLIPYGLPSRNPLPSVFGVEHLPIRSSPNTKQSSTTG